MLRSGSLIPAGQGVEDICKYFMKFSQPLSDFPEGFGAPPGNVLSNPPSTCVYSDSIITRVPNKGGGVEMVRCNNNRGAGIIGGGA